MKKWSFYSAQLVLVLGLSRPGFSHGENKPGPHGGHIRMPGGFHVELVPHSKALEIYLIDIEMKNPVVANSSVHVNYKSKSKATDLECKAKEDHFTCDLPVGGNLKNPGKLVVNAMRMGALAAPAEYRLPFSPFNN